MGFVVRWLFAFVLVAVTYNPTQLNYVKWAAENWQAQLPLAVLLGLLLFVGYVIYLRATLRSIGGFGMFLVLTIVAAGLWVLYDWGWLDLENASLNAWIGIVAIATVLGIGLSWSSVRRALSGQSDMDDISE
jgi:hypothetical protein